MNKSQYDIIEKEVRYEKYKAKTCGEYADSYRNDIHSYAGHERGGRNRSCTGR